MHFITILSVLLLCSFHRRISSVTLIRQPQNQTKFVGENASFECEAILGGYHLGASYWAYKFPQDVIATPISEFSDNFSIIQSGSLLYGHDWCILKNVTKEHHLLTIECVFREIHVFAVLFVYSSPVLYLLEDRFEVTRGQIDPLVVTFSTEGYPDPIYSDTYDWFYNSQLLEESSFIELNSISLTITDPQSFHTGTYTLTTHTVIGNATAEFHIEVFYAPEAGPGTMSLTEEFTVVGKNITLYCEVTEANPPPTTEWLKNNTSISTMDTFVLVAVTLSDHGLYICNISNPIGFVTTEVQLFVYGPSSSPVWNYASVVVSATAILFVWERPVETYGLEVDFYELLVLTQNTSTRFNISGYSRSYLLSYESGEKVYPDTVYIAVIRAYTHSGEIEGNNSLSLIIRTLVSSPIVSSLIAAVSTTGIVIQWEVHSSGLANTDIDCYQIELHTEGVQIIYHTQYTSYIVTRFESHSNYSITLFGVRNGSRGSSLQIEIQTASYGLPPIPLLLQTEQKDLENKTNVIITIREVLIPYMDFYICISCKQNNSTQQIKLFEKISEFGGGNLSLTLNNTQKVNSVYKCTTIIANVFGNNSLNFTFTVLKSTTTATIIILGTSTIGFPASDHSTPFLTTLIVVMSLLLLISLCITVVIVFIVYTCVKSSKYEFLRSETDKENGKSEFTVLSEGLEYEAIRVVEKLANREEIDIENTTCETTSV